MDLNYDISTWEFSLKTMCATRMCQEILEKTRLESSLEDHKLSLLAAEKVDKLKLPLRVRNTLKNMLRPMLDELNKWYSLLPMRIRPILTPQGTVDLLKSTRAAIQLDKEGVFQYVLKYFAKAYKSRHGRRLMPSQIFQDSSPQREQHLVIPTSIKLPHFWYDVYNGHFDGLDCNNLTEEECADGFVHSLRCYQSINIKYFIDRLPLAVVDEILFKHQYKLTYRTFSPAVMALLFSRMREGQQRFLKCHYSFIMLRYLIDWPFQRMFLEAAKTLMKDLTGYQFWSLLSTILCKLDAGYRDCDYVGLFIDLWSLAEHRTRVSYLQLTCQRTLYFVFILRNKRILDLVLKDMTEHDKINFLLCFHMNDLRLKLAHERDYHALEMFIRVCGMNSRDLLIRFKRYFVSDAPELPSKEHVRVCRKPLEVSEWMESLEQIVDITDRIISETPL